MKENASNTGSMDPFQSWNNPVPSCNGCPPSVTWPGAQQAAHIYVHLQRLAVRWHFTKFCLKPGLYFHFLAKTAHSKGWVQFTTIALTLWLQHSFYNCGICLMITAKKFIKLVQPHGRPTLRLSWAGSIIVRSWGLLQCTCNLSLSFFSIISYSSLIWQATPDS